MALGETRKKCQIEEGRRRSLHSTDTILLLPIYDQLNSRTMKRHCQFLIVQVLRICRIRLIFNRIKYSLLTLGHN